MSRAANLRLASRTGQSDRRVSPQGPSIPGGRRRAIQRRLLDWYHVNRRDLPWRRREGDAYAQWVAEIMLQQTRVETVIAYYERFLSRFPTVAALARAGHDEVLKAWEGLGYYRRVLHLHNAARAIDADGRNMPATAEGLRQLAGVGDYTAAAIASIAYGEPVAAVDGNVARVIARLFGVENDVLSAKGKTVLGRLAAELIPADRPGDFNQAWMDLGSSHCGPRSPSCGECPLVTLCVARRNGLTDRLPVRGLGRDTAVPSLTFLVGIFVDRGRVLVRRRPTGGLWSGLWELPNREVASATSARRALRALAGESGVRLSGSARPAGVVKHRLTHRAITFHAHVARATPVDHGGGPLPGYRWVSDGALECLSISTAHRRILDVAREAVLGCLTAPTRSPR